MKKTTKEKIIEAIDANLVSRGGQIGVSDREKVFSLADAIVEKLGDPDQDLDPKAVPETSGNDGSGASLGAESLRESEEARAGKLAEERIEQTLARDEELFQKQKAQQAELDQLREDAHTAEMEALQARLEAANAERDEAQSKLEEMDGPGGPDAAQFASPEAQELFEGSVLTVEDLEGLEPSSTHGFTKPDIANLIDAKSGGSEGGEGGGSEGGEGGGES